MVTIRPASIDDCPAIAEIYRHYVENTVATFDYEPPTDDAWRSKMTTIRVAGRPFLVAEADEERPVIGFAYLGAFRDKQAYDWTVEDTIYLRPGESGRGTGSALMSALLDAADPTTVRQIIAVIAADGGDASIALHAKFGFVEVGRTPDVGYKFDRWIDCVYMQRALTA